MAAQVRAIRGATSIDIDEPAHLTERVVTLLQVILDRNAVDKEDLISILFTATDDIHSMFPATAARTIGLGDVPLICARELDIVGGKARCIRVMVHCTTPLARNELHHIYLEGTKTLRDDLPA